MPNHVWRLWPDGSLSGPVPKKRTHAIPLVHEARLQEVEQDRDSWRRTCERITRERDEARRLYEARTRELDAVIAANDLHRVEGDRAELERAREALRWYADEANVHEDAGAYGHGHVEPDRLIVWDRGERARAALVARVQDQAPEVYGANVDRAVAEVVSWPPEYQRSARQQPEGDDR